tara:strand:- start:317 stop:475 length:159 start_codon:yes stop_codon:yes gene_type:complete
MIPGKGELVKEIRDVMNKCVTDLSQYRANPYLRTFILQLEIVKPTKEKDPEG